MGKLNTVGIAWTVRGLTRYFRPELEWRVAETHGEVREAAE
jgi:hypothetical protein